MKVALENITTYHDKNGERILNGMRLKHDDGSVEMVYLTAESDMGIHDLGFNASNESYLERYGSNRELYPLYQFDMTEWEIIK